MKLSHLLRGSLFLLVLVPLLAIGQVPVTVEFNLQMPSYDVIYLTDLVDLRSTAGSAQLSTNIPEMSIEMLTNPRGQTIQVYLRIRAAIQLRGDAAPQVLVGGQSNDFTLAGSRRLSSRDLSASGSQGITITTTSRLSASPDLRKKLEDYVQRFPTAPVGQYFFDIEAYNASNRLVKLGEVHKVITVRNASESEVVVNLVSPEQNAHVPTPFPTFSWTSEKPEVVLYVYEKLPIHRSAEEAVTGIPFLKRELRGVSTFTYPANAERRLEIGKAYYWFVETKVVTTRGDLTRRSEIRLFRVRPEVGGNALARFLSTLPGDAAQKVVQLIQDGWDPQTMTLDNAPTNQGDVSPLWHRLVRDGVPMNVSVLE